MAPPKKGQKMSIGTFLADESLGNAGGGSWADEMEDMPAVPAASSGYGQRRDYGGASSGGNDRYSGYSRADTDDRFSSRAQLPIPDKPPYTAHVGNLSFDATEMEIQDFFSACDVMNVRLVRDRAEDRPKGFGYVEFNTKEGLMKALDLNNTQLASRSVRISVAEPPKERADDRTAGEWRRTGPLPPLEREAAPRRGSGYDRFADRGDRGGDREERQDRRQASFDQGDGRMRDLGNWERKGPLSPLAPTTPTGSEHGGRPRSGDRGDRRRSPAPGSESGRGFRERPHVERQPSAAEQDNQWRRGARPDAPQRSTPTSPTMPHTRPRLELKKRSEQPAEAGASVSASSDKPSPFGAARPIDTLKREKEVEEKRAALLAEKKAAEDKAREEKKAATASKATSETDDKKSEIGSPTTSSKNFEVIRRGSSPPGEEEVASPVQEDVPAAKEKKPEREREPRPARTGPDNWRSRGPPRDQQQNKEKKQEDEPAGDGWSTVSKPKRGRGPNPRAVPAA